MTYAHDFTAGGDAPQGDLDRYALYAVRPPGGPGRGRDYERRRVYETSAEGVCRGIELMLEEDEIPRGWRVGVLDRVSRRWVVNPFV